MRQVAVLVQNHLRAIMRDRVLYAVLGVALAMILLVPALSSFSMRQVQELAVTLSLSTVSGVLLVVTLLLGASSIWRDIERRYTTSVLTLPISRAAFLLSKFTSIAFFLVLCTIVLGCGSAVVILIAANSYPSDIPLHWGNITVVLAGDIFKYLLLAAFALLLSSVSTSFYLPFFGTLIIYFCGSASQEVFEYVSAEFGQGMSPIAAKVVTVAYYLLPNLSAFDFQVEAVYGLPISFEGVSFAFLYALVYTGILLGLAVFAFGRRELP
ncbi:ABC transporter permease [Desulfuromonas sp. TF]|uniref:ABC transporter permease n=1 Tax=Desulfuromonas sp. TF TaxID=1232410 RepID=UPI0003F50D8A|nr:ABC transporter permease [Desulfuromonas sp. TF]